MTKSQLITLSSIISLSLILSACGTGAEFPLFSVFSNGKKAAPNATAALEVPPDLSRLDSQSPYAVEGTKASESAPPNKTAQESPADIEKKIQQLEALKTKGMLSDAEYQEKRKALLERL